MTTCLKRPSKRRVADNGTYRCRSCAPAVRDQARPDASKVLLSDYAETLVRVLMVVLETSGETSAETSGSA